MENIVKTVLICTSLLILTLTGCKKCYECRSLRATFTFTKNGDTIKNSATYAVAVVDTINFYTSQGYKCDTNLFFWSNFGLDNPACGKEDYDDNIALGNICKEI